jgi:Cu/Ag efflux pump CusA
VAVALVVLWGLIVAPFDYSGSGLPTDPVAVDAIPDIGENQQIVVTTWSGRSPQDVFGGMFVVPVGYAAVAERRVVRAEV